MTRTYFAAILFLVFSSSVCILHAEKPARENSGETLASALNQGDFETYKRLLDELIDSRLKLRKRLSDDKVLLHALAVDELIRGTGVEAMNQVASTPEGKKFLKKFLADRDGLPIYLSSGPYPTDTPDGMQTLAEIWNSDPDVQSGQYMPLATAVALAFHSGEMARRGDLTNIREINGPVLTPIDRYRFYKESHRAGKLHPMFDSLPVWALRWVVCAPFGNETLTWLQENVDVPLSQIDGVCWIPRYRGVNSFGNTIQGPLFYAPSRPVLSCWAEDIAKNGGVCGSLSTFGATYAQARGIPATPKGQPGHCAYTYRAKPGEWVPSFGGPDGGSHYDFWKSSFAYTWMADDLFTDTKNTQAAHQLYWLARYQQEKGGLRDAFSVYQQAIEKQPLHFGIRRDFIDACLADDSGFMDAKKWNQLAFELVAGMQKHPMPMHDLLAKFDEKHVWPSLPPEQRQKLFVSEHRAIASNIRPGWTPWNVPNDVLDRQIKNLSGKEIPLFRDALAQYIQAGHQHLVGEMIGWGSNRFNKSPEEEKAYTNAIVTAFSKGKNVDEAMRRKVFGQAIVAAETSKNIDAFQKLNQGVRDLVKNHSQYDYKAPKSGKLVSDKGLLYVGKLDGYDDPFAHQGVLTEEGGLFHGPGSFDGKPNFAVVALPTSRKLAEIVIVNRPGQNTYRCKALTVYVSNDEQNWTEVEKIEELGAEARVDLRGKNISARWIKVEKGEPLNEHFHLRQICVYAD